MSNPRPYPLPRQHTAHSNVTRCLNTVHTARKSYTATPKIRRASAFCWGLELEAWSRALQWPSALALSAPGRSKHLLLDGTTVDWWTGGRMAESGPFPDLPRPPVVEGGSARPPSECGLLQWGVSRGPPHCRHSPSSRGFSQRTDCEAQHFQVSTVSTTGVTLGVRVSLQRSSASIINFFFWAMDGWRATSWRPEHNRPFGKNPRGNASTCIPGVQVGVRQKT